MGFLCHLCPSHVHSAGFLGSKFQRAYELLVGSGSTSKSLLQHLSQHSAGAFSRKFAQWIKDSKVPNLGRKFQLGYTRCHLLARNSSVYSRAYPIWVGGSSIGDTDRKSITHARFSLFFVVARCSVCATLVASIARGRRWLDELIAKQTATTDSIAKRERCSVRKVNMTISLAFLAPDLVKAAIDGRLPHGMGVARLADLPAEWSRQHQMLGLPAQ